MKKLSIITAAIAIALIAIYYLIGGMIPKGPKGPMDPNRPVPVTVASAKIKSITRYKTLPARIRSTEIAEIRPQISGIILKRYFTEGSFVKKGDTLYQIDPEPYFIELTQAKSQLKAVQIDLTAKKDNFERLEKLYKINAVSKLQFDESKTAFEKAKADLAVKQAELDKVKIKINYSKVLSPIDGKIGRSFVTQGSLVKDFQENALAIVTNLDRVYADISQSSSKIDEIQTALVNQDKIEVELILPGEKETNFKKGFLKFSEAIIEESTGSIALRAEFENQDHKLLPGLFVKAKLNLGEMNLLTIDQSAVIINPDGTMSVYLVNENDTVEIRNITVEEQYKSDWVVSSGLSEGDLVVREGLQKVRPGSKVMPSMPNEEMINMTEGKTEAEENTVVKAVVAQPESVAALPVEAVALPKTPKALPVVLPVEAVAEKSDTQEMSGHLESEILSGVAQKEKSDDELYGEVIGDFIKDRLAEAKAEEFGKNKAPIEASKQEQSRNVISDNQANKEG